MNSIPDPSKKASINSLLNPEASSTAYTNQIPNLPTSLPANQVQPHPHHVDVYNSPFGPASSFHLRAADWSLSDDSVKRKLENGSRYHYQNSPVSPPLYAEHSSARLGRSREEAYAMETQVWQPQQQHDVVYTPPVIAPMYSDERTALSAEYHAHSYSHTYQEHSPPSMSQPWQNSERVSVRLAARGTLQDSRYHEPPSYYQPPPNAVYVTAAYLPPGQYPQSPQQHPSSQQQQAPRVVQPPPEKRQLSEETDTGPKSKKSKTNTNKASGPSKRGYNAKKRNEAAQIAAQNAQLIPSVSYTPMPNEKGKQKADDSPMQIVSTEASGEQALHAELQFARCMSNRYKHDAFPRCVSCTRRWAGDTCRFQGIRFFVKDAQRNIVGISFVEAQKADLPTMDFPTMWNVPLRSGHVKRTKRTIAEALLPILQKEQEHLKLPEIIHRPRESEVRATCDTCMTSIFSTSWMCRLCGREACAECYATVSDLTTDRPGADHAEIIALQVRREKHAHNNPFFLSCTRRNEHQAKEFSPMSRFCGEELEKAIKDMKKLLSEEVGKGVDGETKDLGGSAAGLETVRAPTPVVAETISAASAQQKGPESTQDSNSFADPVASGTLQPSLLSISNVVTPETDGSQGANGATIPIPPSYPNGIPAFSGNPYIPANLSSTILETPTLPLRRYTDSALTEENFPAIWALGEPLVVTGLLPKFKIDWSPQYFMDKYDSQGCLIIECQTEVNKRITVGEFFKDFGKYEGREDCWKLKDWPPSTDFKSAFPELYEDFSRAVPVPSYVRRDGVLNIASHFPANTVAPDLGPKMYNAMASTQGPGSKGSTRLHMDMADALNIMTFAALCPDGTPGCAVWDLFRAEDSDKLRAFLTQRFGPGKVKMNGDVGATGKRSSAAQGGQGQSWTGVNDPIHGQQFYLDQELRADLYKEMGVMSFRFYQRPGEAVFIPAGCAHQVSNMADCIKVAIDFVSPENIERCEKLTKEFREQNQRKVWKEDVLQLRTMMWFAWLSCCQHDSDTDVERMVVGDNNPNS